MEFVRDACGRSLANDVCLLCGGSAVVFGVGDTEASDAFRPTVRFVFTRAHNHTHTKTGTQCHVILISDWSISLWFGTVREPIKTE